MFSDVWLSLRQGVERRPRVPRAGNKMFVREQGADDVDDFKEIDALERGTGQSIMYCQHAVDAKD